MLSVFGVMLLSLGTIFRALSGGDPCFLTAVPQGQHRAFWNRAPALCSQRYARDENDFRFALRGRDMQALHHQIAEAGKAQTGGVVR